MKDRLKSKLGTPVARTIVEAIVTEKLKFFLEENKAGSYENCWKSFKRKKKLEKLLEKQEKKQEKVKIIKRLKDYYQEINSCSK